MTGPPPRPWNTRANTRNVRLGAMPERNELTVNRTVQIRKKRRRPTSPESQPVAGMMIAFAARNDLITHDISSTLAESEPCMCGRATFVTLVSRICMTVTSMTEKVISHFRAAESGAAGAGSARSEEHTSELQSRFDLVCRLLLEKKKLNR